MATKNLKVLMSGDTKPYRAEIDKAAVATKVMKDDIGSHLNSIAGLFGTNMGTIGASAQKISTVFVGLTAAFSGAAAGGSAFAVANAALAVSTTAVAGAEANLAVANAALATAQGTAGISAEALAAAESEVLLATVGLASAQRGQAAAQVAVTGATGIGTIAMGIFKTALIATGIGAFVVVLGSLLAYFSSTREGANKIKVIMAEMGAVVKVLIDRFSSFGEGIFKFLSGDFAGSAKAMKGVFSGIGEEMLSEGSAAGELAKQTQALNKEERENKVLQQQRLTRSAELRNDAKQDGVDANDKKRMLNEAKALIIEYYNEEKHIAIGRRDIAVKDSAMHKNMGDELNALEDAKVKVWEVDQSSAEAQKALSREMKSANKEIAAQAAAIISKAEAQRKADAKGFTVGMKSKDPKLTAKIKPEDVVQDPKLKAIDDKMFTDNLAKSQKQSDAIWRKTSENMDKTKGEFIDLTSAIQGGLADAASGIGEFVGGLMSGEGSIQSFGAMIAGMFGSLATTIGKQMIAFGVAGVALKLLIKNPWTAIAAGIGLIALGSLATASIGSSLSGGGASGSMPNGNQNYNYDTRGSTSQSSAQKVIVEVTGTLSASAKGLSTTLNKENTRVNITT